MAFRIAAFGMPTRHLGIDLTVSDSFVTLMIGLWWRVIQIDFRRGA